MNNEDAAAGAVLEFKGRLSYGDYLHLDELLESQRPRTDAHDEMLFIIQHQTTELWFRLVQHELDMAMAGIDADELGPAFKPWPASNEFFAYCSTHGPFWPR